MAAASSRLPALFLLFCLYYCSMSPIHVRFAGSLSFDFNFSHPSANLSRCFFCDGAASISGSPSMLELTPAKPELAIHAAALSFNYSCSDYPALSRHDTSSLATNSTVGICSVLALGLCFSRALAQGPDVGSLAIRSGSSTITRHVILLTDVDLSIEASLRKKQLPNCSIEFFSPIFPVFQDAIGFSRSVSSERSGICYTHLEKRRRIRNIDFGCSFRDCTGSATPRRLLSGTYGRRATKRHVATPWHVAYTSWMDQKTVVRAGIAGSALLGLICAVAGLLLCCIRTKRPWQRAAAVQRGDDEPIIREPELIRRGLGPRLFRYSELAAATRSFAEDMKIGRGGFGPVYRGQLTDQDRRHVAIKLLSREQSVQGLKEFQAEVTIISQLRHRNIVQLVGWCDSRRGLALVYELMQGGSLDTHLYNPERHLTWSERYRIALGLGSALHYLHVECDWCVVHGDIKPANVMLDASRDVKLGDFGLARLVDHGAEPLTTQVVAGTVGYIDPELVNSRKPSTESDVYSFGVALLEIACGRRPTSRQPDQAAALLAWVRDMHDRNLILDVADQRLDAEFDKLQMERLLVTGLWCAHHDPTQRPSIAQAMDVLRSEDAKLPVLPVMPGSGEVRSLEGRAYGDLSAENSTYFSTTTAYLTTED